MGTAVKAAVAARQEQTRPLARFLAVVSLLGSVYFGLSVIALHLLHTGYNPVSQEVSDYAVGPFGLVMDFAFTAAGVGGMSLAAALSLSYAERDRAGALLLFLAGAGTFLLGLFPIDLQGTPATTHGAVHSAASLLVFVTQPIGAVLVSRRFGARGLWATFAAFAVAAAVFVLDQALSLGATGLSERVFLGVIVSWSALASVRTIRR